jgi:hypothetical protein
MLRMPLTWKRGTTMTKIDVKTRINEAATRLAIQFGTQIERESAFTGLGEEELLLAVSNMLLKSFGVKNRISQSRI